MSSYHEPQWSFLLGGTDIEAFVIDDTAQILLGNVIRVKLSDAVSGYGMVLVAPSQRGKGYARRLIDAAMQHSRDDGTSRHVLAICTKLGVPVYRKMGFKEAGFVTGLSGPVSSFYNVALMEDEKSIQTTFFSSGISASDENEFAKMDRKAVGYDRQNRLKLLLDGAYSPESLSAIAFATSWNDETKCDAAVGAAAIRQDCPGGPLIIGPVMGEERCAIPLIQELARSFPARNNADDDAVVVPQLSIMISDHPSLVERFAAIDRVTVGIKGPAMSMDGKHVYEGGDGSYLALMHPDRKSVV